MSYTNGGTTAPSWNIDPTYGAVGFSPEERDEAFVHKHRVLAHEALMRIDAAGLMGAWRAARAYGRALLSGASGKFEDTYRASAHAFAAAIRGGKHDPVEVIGSLVIYCDQEARDQGRLGKSESAVSRENAGVGLVVGTGRLNPERLSVEETIVYDERTGHLLISEAVKLDEAGLTPLEAHRASPEYQERDEREEEDPVEE